MITPRKETTRVQDPESSNHQQHTLQEASYEQQTSKNTNPVISRPPHSALPIRTRASNTIKQQKAQHKSHPIQSLHKPLNQSQEGRNQKEKRSQS